MKDKGTQTEIVQYDSRGVQTGDHVVETSGSRKEKRALKRARKAAKAAEEATAVTATETRAQSPTSKPTTDSAANTIVTSNNSVSDQTTAGTGDVINPNLAATTAPDVEVDTDSPLSPEADEYMDLDSPSHGLETLELALENCEHILNSAKP